MPAVTFEVEPIECEEATNCARRCSVPVCRPTAARRTINCGGRAICGTCAVEIDGRTDEMGEDERGRLSKWPHDLDSGLRLACQTRVEGDLTVRKHGGFWGQDIDQ